MNIVIVTGSTEHKCGIGVYALKLLQALARCEDNLTFTMLVPYGHRPTDLPSSVLFKTVMPGRPFRSFISELRPDILHLQYPSLTREFLGYFRDLPWCKFVAKTRIVITAHETLVKYNINSGVFVAAFLATCILTIKGKRNIPFGRRCLSNSIVPLKNVSMLPSVELSHDRRIQIRESIGNHGNRTLISFIGFLTDSVRLEWLFKSCECERHQLAIMGEVPEALKNTRSDYFDLCEEYGWKPQKVFLGYKPDLVAADILAASDVVVLPFRKGCNEWNTSYLAACQQGCYVVTTSATKRGYCTDSNTYFVAPGNIDMFKDAINNVRPAKAVPMQMETWTSLAKKHVSVYGNIQQYDFKNQYHWYRKRHKKTFK
ncbi:MAG: glycosyltransferase [Phycisphaerae bacterium]|nr:glycosyltransferase [Phycisphaerae bacterium]